MAVTLRRDHAGITSPVVIMTGSQIVATTNAISITATPTSIAIFPRASAISITATAIGYSGMGCGSGLMVRTTTPMAMIAAGCCGEQKSPAVPTGGTATMLA